VVRVIRKGSYRRWLLEIEKFRGEISRFPEKEVLKIGVSRSLGSHKKLIFDIKEG